MKDLGIHKRLHGKKKRLTPKLGGGRMLELEFVDMDNGRTREVYPDSISDTYEGNSPRPLVEPTKSMVRLLYGLIWECESSSGSNIV